MNHPIDAPPYVVPFPDDPLIALLAREVPVLSVEGIFDLFVDFERQNSLRDAQGESTSNPPFRSHRAHRCLHRACKIERGCGTKSTIRKSESAESNFHTSPACATSTTQAIPISVLHPKFGRGIVLEGTASFLFVRFGQVDIWVPRNDDIKRKLAKERQLRARISDTLWRMSPDARPEGYKTVTFAPQYPSFAEILKLVAIGYDFDPARCVLQSSSPLNVARTGDRRQRNGVTGGQVPLGTNAYPDIVAQPLSQRDARRRGLRIRLAADGRIPEDSFMSLLRQTRYDLPMQSALRETLVLGRRVADVARARYVKRQTLSEATRRLRKLFHEMTQNGKFFVYGSFTRIRHLEWAHMMTLFWLIICS